MMSCVIMSEYFPHFNETVSLKIISMFNGNVKWYEYDGVVKGLHYSKSSNVLLQHVEPWAMKKFKDICRENNYTVEFFNQILKQNFHPDQDFLTECGVYQLMMGSTRSPSNSIKNWYIRCVLRPGDFNMNNNMSSISDIKFESISSALPTLLSPHVKATPTSIAESIVDDHEKCSWHFELKIPYECDTNLIICDKHGTKFKLSKFN